MNYGFYLSAAGTLTNLYRQDVAANNLANIRSVGFKPDNVHFKSRLPERVEGPLASVESAHHMLEELGGGSLVAPTHTSMTQGPLRQTENPLDLAIEGDGFFVVQTGEAIGAERMRFTRDGRFTINTDGELVTATTGMRVLDDNDRPIRLNPTVPVRVESTGEIFQGTTRIAQLQLVGAPDQRRLHKEGDNLFVLNNFAQAGRLDATGSVKQGFLEESSVDPVMTLNELMAASKAAQANAKLMQYHDSLMDQAINTLGRIA